MPTLNHYQLLGVAPQATSTQIKQAYRQLALRYHPDVNRRPGATAHFLAIKTAMETLTDPRRRSGYDYSLRSQMERLKRLERSRSQQQKTPTPQSTRGTSQATASPKSAPQRPAYEPAPPAKPPADAPVWFKIDYFFRVTPLHFYLLLSAGLNFLVSIYHLVFGVVPLSFVYERRVSPIAMEGMAFVVRTALFALLLVILTTVAREGIRRICREIKRKQGQPKTSSAYG